MNINVFFSMCFLHVYLLCFRALRSCKGVEGSKPGITYSFNALFCVESCVREHVCQFQASPAVPSIYWRWIFGRQKPVNADLFLVGLRGCLKLDDLIRFPN